MCNGSSSERLEFLSCPQSGISKPASRILAAAVLVAAFSFSLVIHFSHLSYWKRHQAFYYDHDTPLMSTLDAYYYLRVTSQILNEQEAAASPGDPPGQSRASAPLLASLTALIHKTSNIPIEQIAFYLPPVLGSCMAIVYTGWGCSLGGPIVALLASLAGVSSFYWYSRTCLGRFDTDCLNPFFVFAILFLVYRFVLSRGRVRLLYAASALAMVWAFNLWWRQVAHLGFILIALSYGLSFYLPSSKGERAVKIAMLIAIGGGVLITFTRFQHVLPGQLAGFIDAYASQFALISENGISNSMFPDVGKSISELQPLSIYGMAGEVGGHPASFVVSMIGLFLLVKRNKETACFLLTGLLLASLSLTARRFLIFCIPLYALGLGYFMGEIILKGKLLQRLAKPFLKWSIFLLIAGGLLSPNLYMSLTRHRGPSLTQGDVFLARNIINEAGKKAVVWSWWDYGYFLEYFTGAKAFIDGGRQTSERAFIAAFPLACSNPLLAGNWMRFFAEHDLDGLHTLTHYLGSSAKSFDFLERILAMPDRSSQILEAYGFRDEDAWKRYLFPDVPVFLYLNADLLNKTYWWYYFGTWNPERQEGSYPEFWIVRVEDPDNFMKDGLVTIGKHEVKVKGLVVAGLKRGVLKELTHTGTGKVPSELQEHIFKDGEGIENEKVAISTKNSNLFYIVNEKTLQTLALTLSLLRPYDTGGFDPLAYHPEIGGVWRVE